MRTRGHAHELLSALALIAELERWQQRGAARLGMLYPCPVCSAVDTPCEHLARADRGARLHNSIRPQCWRADLAAGEPATTVLREMRRSQLYRRLAELDLLGGEAS